MKSFYMSKSTPNTYHMCIHNIKTTYCVIYVQFKCLREDTRLKTKDLKWVFIRGSLNNFSVNSS